MALNTAALQVAGAALAGAVTFVGLASALPDATGSNATTHARLASGMTSTNGVVSLGGAKNFTGGAANGPVLYLTYWSAATAGTFYGFQALTGDTASNAAGQYTVNTATLTGSAT